MTPAYAFLVLEDDEDNRFLIVYALRKGFPGSHVIECATAEDALRAAHEFDLSGVVTDHHISDIDGATLMETLRERGTTCPVVMVTSSSDPAVYRRAYDAGAARVFAEGNYDIVGYFHAILGRPGTD